VASAPAPAPPAAAARAAAKPAAASTATAPAAPAVGKAATPAAPIAAQASCAGGARRLSTTGLLDPAGGIFAIIADGECGGGVVVVAAAAAAVVVVAVAAVVAVVLLFRAVCVSPPPSLPQAESTFTTQSQWAPAESSASLCCFVGEASQACSAAFTGSSQAADASIDAAVWRWRGTLIERTFCVNHTHRLCSKDQLVVCWCAPPSVVDSTLLHYHCACHTLCK